MNSLSVKSTCLLCSLELGLKFKCWFAYGRMVGLKVEIC